MNKRLGLILVSSAVALAWTGCDNNPPAGDAGCPDGTICLTDDGGPGDAGPRDSGPGTDAGPGFCMQTGRSGGTCRSGTTCGVGLTCFEELTRGTVGPFTLANIFEIPSAVSDPANPGEFITEVDDPTLDLPDVPIGFGPGGQCTVGCNPEAATDSCAACSTCSSSIGGSGSFGAVGISVRTFDSPTAPITSQTNTGICRADCTFDTATNGGCQTGYSCDVSDRVCLEACVSDSQCNLGWGVTRRDGLVAVVEGDATCDATTGRCDWTPPAGAAFGSECEDNTDCPADIGFCVIGGRCTTWQCNIQGAGGAPLNPCATGAICVEFSGITEPPPSVCMQTCTTPADCFAGVACIALSTTVNACWGICGADSECHTDERCQLGGFSDETIGTCQPFCTPGGSDCSTEELCVPVEGQTYGFCRELNQICSTDAGCWGTQACEHLGNDALGRCVDGCDADTDCAAGSSCRIQEGGQTCTAATAEEVCNTESCVGTTCAPSTFGVCRALGVACSLSPDRDEDGLPDLILRGNPQCAPGQTCSSTTADVLGTCTGTIPPPDAGTDAGPPDAGPPDAGEPDAGEPDAGVDAGSAG